MQEYTVKNIEEKIIHANEYDVHTIMIVYNQKEYDDVHRIVVSYTRISDRNPSTLRNIVFRATLEAYINDSKLNVLDRKSVDIIFKHFGLKFISTDICLTLDEIIGSIDSLYIEGGNYHIYVNDEQIL